MIATRRFCRDNVGNGGGRRFCDARLLLAAHVVVEMRLRVKSASCSVGHPISAILDSNVTRKFFNATRFVHQGSQCDENLVIERINRKAFGIADTQSHGATSRVMERLRPPPI
jgi:hypothetical protein